jgi:hypothetical protein
MSVNISTSVASTKQAFFVPGNFTRTRSKTRKQSLNQSKENQLTKQLLQQTHYPGPIERQLLLSRINSFNNSQAPSFIRKKTRSRDTPDRRHLTDTMPIVSDDTVKHGPLNYLSNQHSKDKASSKTRRKMMQILSKAKLSFDKNGQSKNGHSFIPCQTETKNNNQTYKPSKEQIKITGQNTFDCDSFFGQVKHELALIATKASERGYSRSKTLGLTIKRLRLFHAKLLELKSEDPCSEHSQIESFLSTKIQECEAAKSAVDVTTTDCAVQTSPRQLSPNEFIEACKNFSSELLKQGLKGEFKLNDLIKFLESQGHFFEELDFEAQKLLKTLCDCIQKQLIFEGVIRILEKENINIEEYIQCAYERVMKQLLQDATEEETQSVQHSESLTFSSQKLTTEEYNINSFDLGEKQSKNKMLCLNLDGLKTNGAPDRTPKGFHQEFSDMAKEFSLSWRMQLEKEQNKRKQFI